MKRVLFCTLLMVLPITVVCSDGSSEKKDSTETKQVEKKAIEEKKAPELQTTKSGVRYEDLVVGKGKEAAIGSKVEVHYTIWTADSTGLKTVKKIQSSKDSGKTFTCTLGRGLIQGWSDGSVGMKEGGTRRLYVPWELGYGANGMPRGGIPGKANLIFEIDYIKAL